MNLHDARALARDIQEVHDCVNAGGCTEETLNRDGDAFWIALPLLEKWVKPRPNRTRYFNDRVVDWTWRLIVFEKDGAWSWSLFYRPTGYTLAHHRRAASLADCRDAARRLVSDYSMRWFAARHSD